MLNDKEHRRLQQRCAETGYTTYVLLKDFDLPLPVWSGFFRVRCNLEAAAQEWNKNTRVEQRLCISEIMTCLSAWFLAGCLVYIGEWNC